MKINALWDVLQTRMVRRNVPVKNLKLGDIETASGSSVRRVVTLQQGIPERRGTRHHQVPQGSEVQKGAGQHSGRSAPYLLGLQRRAAGRHPAAPRARLRHCPPIRQLPVRPCAVPADKVFGPADARTQTAHASCRKCLTCADSRHESDDKVSSYQSDSPIPVNEMRSIRQRGTYPAETSGICASGAGMHPSRVNT